MKKTMDVILVVVWILAGVSALLSDNISHLTYGCCWAVLMIQLIDRLVDDYI